MVQCAVGATHLRPRALALFQENNKIYLYMKENFYVCDK